MKKLIKFVLWLVIVLVVIALAVVLTLPWWISPVVKTAVNTVGPQYTQTKVNLGDFAFNFYNGTLRVGDFQLGNPRGYANEQAFTLGKLEVEVEPKSVFTETVHIKLIRIKDVYVSYDLKGTKSNFDAIKEAVDAKVSESQAAEKTVERPSAGEQQKVNDLVAEKNTAGGENNVAREKTAAVEEENVVEEKNASKKVIIDRLEIAGVLVQLGPIPMPLPPLTLTDIGKKSNGILLSEAWKQVSEEVMKSVGVLGNGASVLGGEAAKQLNKATKHLDKAAKVLGGATEVLNSVGIDKAAGATVDTATKAAGATVDTATKTIESTGKLLKGLFK